MWSMCDNFLSGWERRRGWVSWCRRVASIEVLMKRLQNWAMRHLSSVFNGHHDSLVCVNWKSGGDLSTEARRWSVCHPAQCCPWKNTIISLKFEPEDYKSIHLQRPLFFNVINRNDSPDWKKKGEVRLAKITVSPDVTNGRHHFHPTS